MDAKFYIKNLTSSSKQNSGEENQNETDPIKIYLNELASKAIENKVSYFDVLNPEDPSPTILDENFYTSLLEQSQANINPENKIGDENNYEFVIMEYPDNINDYLGSPNEIYEHSKFIFVNEENAKYFLNKFIKISTKQFIKSSLYSIDFQYADVFSDLDINAKNFEEKIAINNLKFAIDIGVLESNLIVTDDIDLQVFYILRDISDNKVRCVFDENEDKIMFEVRCELNYIFHYILLFKFSNDLSNATIIENINGINYKYVDPQENGDD